MSLTNRYFCRIMTLLTFPRKPLGFIQRLMVEESLENPIDLQTGKICNRMGTEGARLCDGAVP